MGDAFRRIGNNYCNKLKPLVPLEFHGINIVHNYDYIHAIADDDVKTP